MKSKNPWNQNSNNEMNLVKKGLNMKNVFKIGLLATAGALALSIPLGAYYTVAEYERGVVVRFGKFQYVSTPGLGFKVPFIDTVIKYPVNIRQATLDKINTYTIDNQELDAKFTIVYRIPAENVESVYRNVPDFETKILSLAIDRFKAELGKVNTTEVAQQRGIVAKNIFTVLRAETERLFKIELVDFQINEIDYTKSFRAAVDAAASAKANVEKAEQDLRRSRIEAEQIRVKAEGEANAARETAKGQADATLYNAEAEAKAIELKGAATAEAISAQAKALGSNTNLVELEKAKQWDGKLPTQMFSGVTPLMTIAPPK